MSQAPAPDVGPFRIVPIRSIGPIFPPSSPATARDFHASKMLTPSSLLLPSIITKRALYRDFLLCTAKRKFSFSLSLGIGVSEIGHSLPASKMSTFPSHVPDFIVFHHQKTKSTIAICSSTPSAPSVKSAG
jgi:hypothetical protein